MKRTIFCKEENEMEYFLYRIQYYDMHSIHRAEFGRQNNIFRLNIVQKLAPLSDYNGTNLIFWRQIPPRVS
jgi:hypothetical protein